MQVIMRYIHMHYPHSPIDISAQLYLKNFYGHFGFKTIGQPYDDGGILHTRMVSTANTPK